MRLCCFQRLVSADERQPEAHFIKNITRLLAHREENEEIREELNTERQKERELYRESEKEKVTENQ